jgi:putative MATE family efflux protein
MPAWLDRVRKMGRRPERDGPNPVLAGKVTPTLLGLSVPMILAMVLVTFFGLVDMFYLGRFSKEAMAAVGLAFPVTYLLHTFGGALGSACTSTCSRLIGAGRRDEVPNLLLHVILISAIVAVVLIPTGMLLIGVEPTLNSPDTDPTVREMARQYGLIYFLGGFFSLFAMSVNALFRGEGDTAFPFKVMAVGLVLNIILDPLFIFGPGPFPRLGVAGAAVTTVVSFAAASLLVLRELLTADRIVRLARGAWAWRPDLVRDVLRVAAPASLANLALPVSVFLINAMVAGFGTAAVAGYAAARVIHSIVFLPTLGLSMAMMIMVGQNHGAGQRDRVREITLTTLRFSLTLVAALSLPIVLFPEWATGWVTNDPAVVAAGAPLVQWGTLTRPMLGIVNITAFWFQARGQGLAGMLPNTAMRMVFEPLGVWVGLQFGALATGWYGFAVGDVVGGLVFLALLLWRLRVYTRGGPRTTLAAGTSAGSS